MTPGILILLTTAVVFAIGMAAVFVRRNPIAMLMGVELMLNSAMLAMVVGAKIHGNAVGLASPLLILVLGAAEAVIGLALALAVFRTRERVDVDDVNEVAG